MKRRDAILTLIDALSGRHDLGRTALQKAAYFVDARLRLGFGHSAYYYGPFSSALESDVVTLVNAGLVREKEHRLGFVNQQGFEGRQYEYDLDDAGKERVARIADKYPDEVDEIRRVAATLLASPHGLDQKLLSAAAKVHYIEELEGELTPEEIEEVARQFNWTLPASTVERVRRLLADLDL